MFDRGKRRQLHGILTFFIIYKERIRFMEKANVGIAVRRQLSKKCTR